MLLNLGIKNEILIASAILFLIISITTISVASASPNDVTTSAGNVIAHMDLIKDVTASFTDAFIIWAPSAGDPKIGESIGFLVKDDPDPAVFNAAVDGNPNLRTEDFTGEEKMAIDLSAKAQFEGIVKQNDATKSYNCHSFAFDKSKQWLGIKTNADPTGQIALNTIIADQGYVPLKIPEVPMPGDLIIYKDTAGNIIHSGKVTKADGMGGVTEVQSKWAWAGEYLHHPDISPYGTTWEILRSPMANPEIGNPITQENNNLFEIEEAIEIDTDVLPINAIEVDPNLFDPAPPCIAELDLNVSDLITFEFDMRVDEIVGDDEGLLDGILDVNDMIHGTYSFVPDALDLNPTSEIGVFDFVAYSLHFDSVVYENILPFLPECDAIFVANDFFGTDEYITEACNLEQQSGPPVTEFGSFFFALEDTDQTVFDDDSLPLMLPDIIGFEENFASLFLSDFEFVEDGSVTSPQQLRSQLETHQGVFIQINGIITSLELQPTPPPPQPPIVGGEFLLTDSTALLLAGAQSFSWMIPVVLGIVGIGLFVVSRKTNE